MTKEYFLDFLISTLHVPIHCYSKDKDIMAVYGSDPSSKDPLIADPEFLSLLLSKKCTDLPAVHVEFNSVYWYIIWGREQFHVIGPLCSRIPDHKLNTQFSQLHHLPEDANFRLSFSDVTLAGRMALFLHNWLNDTEIEFYQFTQKRFFSKELASQIQKNIAQSHYTYQEQDMLHNPYSREVREMNCIRQGNRTNLERVINESFSGQYGNLSKDSLRSVKYLAVCGTVLASRAAIDGGLLPEVAFTVADSYIRSFDETTSAAQIIALGQECKYYFADMVKALGDNKNDNKLIQNCKEHILQHLHSSFTIKDLAAELHVSPDYLSKLFLQVEKINLKQYITQQKILAAQNLLIYTDKDYSEIGYTLGYSSQSHFIRTFQKETGLTPRNYRKLHQ